MLNHVRHTELFETAIQIRERFADRYESQRDSGKQNPLAKRSRARKRVVCAGFGLIACVGLLVAMPPAHSFGFAAGLVLFAAGLAGMMFLVPFVLSRRAMEWIGRMMIPANAALRWVLIFALIVSVAFQVVMAVRAPNEAYRIVLSVIVLTLQIGAALTVRVAYAGMPILSTRTRDGAPWQRRSANLWLFAQLALLAGFVATTWATEALSIIGGSVVVALILYMVGCQRTRTQQIATARADLVQRLTDLRSVYGPGRVPTLDEVRPPLLAFQDLCNEDLSDPRAGLLGRTLVDSDLALVVDYCAGRLLGCPESVRQLEYAEFFRNGCNGEPGLSSSSVDDLIAALGEFVEELRHRLHHPFLTAKQAERFAGRDEVTQRGWNAFSR